jgi:hypothetical protein
MSNKSNTSSSSFLYISHGGGPLPLLGDESQELTWILSIVFNYDFYNVKVCLPVINQNLELFCAMLNVHLIGSTSSLSGRFLQCSLSEGI